MAAGTVGLTALATAETAISGSDSLSVSGTGPKSQQGGPFRAAPGRPVPFGSMTLGAKSGSH